MVCSGALGFILLFLLPPALGVDNLQNIINHLYDSYGGNYQFALGINVPVRYCSRGAVLDQNFLSQDRDGRKVKRDMAGADRIYRGTQLIGARPKQIPEDQNNYHSEYLLLIRSMSQTLTRFDPLMQTLLNSDPDGCTVFYTLYSPCVRSCSTPTGPYSIVPALQMFQNRNTRAFVFSYVWDYDEGCRTWRENMMAINDIIPVFRCDEHECIRCVQNNQVNQKCLWNNGNQIMQNV